MLLNTGDDKLELLKKQIEHLKRCIWLIDDWSIPSEE